jgi:hypothetical protein
MFAVPFSKILDALIAELIRFSTWDSQPVFETLLKKLWSEPEDSLLKFKLLNCQILQNDSWIAFWSMLYEFLSAKK